MAETRQPTQRRKAWSTRSTKAFSSGKIARAICDRSGFEYPMSQMIVEPGTNYLVHRSESDGMWNLVDHPQNYPPRKLGDAVALKNPRVDRVEPIFCYDSEGNILTNPDGSNKIEGVDC